MSKSAQTIRSELREGLRSGVVNQGEVMRILAEFHGADHHLKHRAVQLYIEGSSDNVELNDCPLTSEAPSMVQVTVVPTWSL